MSIARVQGASQTANSVASIALAYASNVKAGSLLTCTAFTTTATPTCADSVNGAWVRAYAQAQTTDGHFMVVFYLANAGAGATTVTVTDGANTHAILIEEWSGAALTSPVRGSPSSAQADSVTSVSSGSVSAISGDLCYGSAGNSYDFTPQSFTAAGITAGGTWQISQQDPGIPSTQKSLCSQYVIATANGSYSCAASDTTADQMTSGIIVFKPLMAISQLQANNSITGATTYASPVSAGSLLTASVRVGNTGLTITGSDGTNGAWTQAYEQDLAIDGDSMYVFYLVNSSAAASLTFTVAGQGGNSIFVIIEEWAGTATSSVVDGSPVSAQGASALSSGNKTASIGELCYGTAANDNGGTGTWAAGGTSAGGTWAISQTAGGFQPLMTQFVIATAPGTFSSFPTTATGGPYINYSSGLVLFKPPASNPIQYNKTLSAVVLT